MAKLTAANRKRLDKLATYLEGLPEDYARFGMRSYCRPDSYERAAKSVYEYARKNGGVASCGAVACAVGHGPAAGILVPPRFANPCHIDWNGYAGLFVGDWATAEYDWAFSGDWRHIDDSHRGAAARIRYMLDKGLPEGFEGDDDIRGELRLLYAPYRIDAKPTEA